MFALGSQIVLISNKINNGLISNCFIYHDISEASMSDTDVGGFDTFLISYKAKINSKAMAQDTFPQGVPRNEV